MIKQYAIIFLLISFSFILIGCMVGPEYSRPQTAADVSDGYTQADSNQQDVNDLSAIDDWWESFGDPVTSELVREALANNYDLKAAAARVLQAQATLSGYQFAQLPSVSYNLSRDRSKRSFNLGQRFSVMSSTWSQDISVNYILDLFGKLERSERMAWASMLATEANRYTLINTLIASVVTSRINIAVIQKQLAIARANIESQRQTLDIVQRRYEQGLVGPVDVRLASGTLASLKAIEPALELSLIKASNALDVLLGRLPGSSELLPETFEIMPELGSVPVGIPASLIERRPDILAAEYMLKAANEQIGLGIAQFYPDLNLMGTYGFSGDTMEEVFKYDYTEMYAAVVSFAQPIFLGGQLRAQVKAARAYYDEQAANYANVVLNAVREVEDALITEQKLQAQLEQSWIRLAEAQAAEDLSRQRYQSGVESILTVLESQRSRRASEEEILILHGQILIARVNLYLALGGDWVNNDIDDSYSMLMNN